MDHGAGTSGFLVEGLGVLDRMNTLCRNSDLGPVMECGCLGLAEVSASERSAYLSHTITTKMVGPHMVPHQVGEGEEDTKILIPQSLHGLTATSSLIGPLMHASCRLLSGICS